MGKLRYKRARQNECYCVETEKNKLKKEREREKPTDLVSGSCLSLLPPNLSPSWNMVEVSYPFLLTVFPQRQSEPPP
jgi:hypothetical protein